MKRLTPATGPLIVEDDDPRRYGPSRRPRIGPRWHALAAGLRAGGADMLAVATNEDHFGGVLDDLRTVEFTRLPRLRSDWVIDECMVLEGSVFGADAITLVPSVLDDATLVRLRALAREYGIAVVVEAADERELDRALGLEPELVAACARDPRTLAADPTVAERLLPRVPKGPLRVASGGIRSVEDLQRARAAGADVAIVGSALCRAPDPAALLASWTSALHGA
jgi:indole-3-glycerol phosphate synthase